METKVTATLTLPVFRVTDRLPEHGERVLFWLRVAPGEIARTGKFFETKCGDANVFVFVEYSEGRTQSYYFDIVEAWSPMSLLIL